MMISISDEVFKQFRDFIYEKSGIFIPDNKKYFLENRLGRRIQELNLKGYEDYLYNIRYNSDSRELQRLFDLITTNETFFFREPQQFEVFRSELLNQITAENAKKGRRDIKIWSAASSTGEEAYTLSIVLLEKIELGGFKKDIFASDISESVLTSARAGVYGSYAIRNVPNAYLNKYFKNTDQQYSLSSAVKSMVKFSRLNLVEEKDVRMIRGVRSEEHTSE